METQINLFGDDYELTERISAKARSIRIEVRPDRGVSLIYPRWVARVEALAFLRSREAWIRDKLAEMAQQASAYPAPGRNRWDGRSEEHTSELQSLMRSTYAVFCL